MVQQMRIDGIQIPLDEYRKMVAETTPQKRWIEASEIGAVAAFLCQDEAFGITAQDLTVAGGSPW
jgi:3-hydroxybutyrate dehydrogenase